MEGKAQLNFFTSGHCHPRSVPAKSSIAPLPQLSDIEHTTTHEVASIDQICTSLVP